MENRQIEYQSSSHHFHVVVYHLIFCPKYGRALLVDQVAACLEQIIRQVAAENKWKILELAIRPDHIRLFARADAEMEPAYRIVGAVKRRSSRLLRQEFPRLRRLNSLWTHSYFCSTEGKVSAPDLSFLPTGSCKEDPVGFGPSWYDLGQGTGRAPGPVSTGTGRAG